MARKKKEEEIVPEGTEQEKALAIVKSAIAKQFGQGTIMQGKDSLPPVERFSSGCISLDRALGGGWGRGRMIEIFGPASSGKTTLTLHAIAEEQKNGGTAAFIDAEHAFDPSYAGNLGVNMDTLLFSQPDSAEEALEVVEMLVRSGAVQLIVVDSVAALVPQKEIEGGMGDSHMGLQARLMSQAMRKLSGVTKKTGTTIIWINQIRMKIGVMFGCLHYDTLVNFTDGESIPIGRVVDEKIKGEVYCVNSDTGAIQEKPILNWHDNGKVETPEDFIHIQTKSIDGRGRFGFTCTPKHKIMTRSGWKEAQNISYEDRLISKYLKTITGSYEMFMKGVLIGDSHVSINGSTASLRLQDNKNPQYINWKLDKLSSFLQFTERSIDRGYRYDSEYTYELAKYKKENTNRNPIFLLSDLHPIGLSLWIMDDGHLDLRDSHMRYIISIKRFKNDLYKLEQIKGLLTSNGFPCKSNPKDGSIVFNKETTLKIADYISEWVPESMQYKLPEQFRGNYKEYLLSNNEYFETEEVKIVEIRTASPRQMRNKRKFDISVEGNHNYMVGGSRNGILVHNSPETVTGGNALKFYASQRVDVRRIGGVKDGDELVANKTRAKVVKNKIAPPFRQAEFEIRYGEGIDITTDLIDVATDAGILERSGSWYSYENNNIGQGAKQVRSYLLENPEIAEEIKAKL